MAKARSDKTDRAFYLVKEFQLTKVLIPSSPLERIPIAIGRGEATN